MKAKILNILNSELNGFYFTVTERKHFDGSDYIAINIATSDYQINGVRGQYYNNISLRLDSDFSLKFQVFGGNGGQCFYRAIDSNNPAEKFYALQRVKIPFRAPQKKEEAVLKSIKNICIKYKELLKQTFEAGLLRSENLEHTKKLIL